MARKKQRVVKSGVYEGHRICRARIEKPCEGWNTCKAIIKPGDWYVEGHGNGKAGPFGRERICLVCAEVSITEIDADH